MSDWTPGEGWRETSATQFDPPYIALVSTELAKDTRYWVREDPVPPLPIEPWTVATFKWTEPRDGAWESTLMWDGYTWSADQVGSFQAEWLHKKITGFEVLARPVVGGGIALAAVRRETAKAVADFAEEIEGPYVAHRIRAEFGVES